MLRVYQFLQAWGLINYGVDQTAAGGARDRQHGATKGIASESFAGCCKAL